MNTKVEKTGSEYEQHKKEMLSDPIVKAEYDRLGPEYQASRALIAARIEKGLTQKQLAEISGMKQSNISRIENMICCPSLATLDKLAQSLNKTLTITFK